MNKKNEIIIYYTANACVAHQNTKKNHLNK